MRCDDEGRDLIATDSWQVEHLLDADAGGYGCENVETDPAGDGAIVQVTAYYDTYGSVGVLWATDGTRPGTFRIPLDPRPSVRGPVALADRAIFLTNDYTAGSKTRLWHSDASVAGTATEVELRSNGLVGWDGMASDGSSACFFDRWFDSLRILQRQLWCSDGTASGTRTVGPVLTDARGYIEGGLVSLAGRIYFCGIGDSNRLLSLFSIDEQGVVAEIRPEAPAIGACRDPITVARGRLWIYDGYSGSGPVSLWVSDGTPAGTLLLAELPGQGSNPIPLGDAVFFVPNVYGDADYVHELWRSDGTVSGTGPLYEVASLNTKDPSSLDAHPVAQDPIVAGGRIWFAGIDREHGAELWSTDGTAAGTRLETDLAPGPAWSSPRSLVPIGDKLYFVADDTERTGIWVLDLD